MPPFLKGLANGWAEMDTQDAAHALPSLSNRMERAVAD